MTNTNGGQTPKMDNTAQIRALESEQENVLDCLDGADLFTILMVLAENETDPLEVLEGREFRQILRLTQSDPDRAFDAIYRALLIDDQIAQLDGTDTN